jgi:FkbM family methyltransferase
MALEVARFECAALLRPLLYRLPRGYGLAYRLLLGPMCSTYRGDALLKDKLSSRYRVFYDRHLACNVLADVGDAGSRNHYVLGRYYESFVPLIISSCLKESDTFIDVGANRGVHTMFASRYLSSGHVFAFEPNPRTFQVLQAHLTMNALNNCRIYNVGLSDENGTLELNLFADDAPSGCSFIDKGENLVKQRFTVPVQRLDDVLGPIAPGGRVLIKIDTEGFEHHVIRGMEQLLENHQVAIVTEIVNDWLQKAGSSAQALFDDLVGRGFRAYRCSTRFAGLKETLNLEQISKITDLEKSSDLLFTKSGMLPTV